jgi:rhodanese-related sulfurtransferase
MIKHIFAFLLLSLSCHAQFVKSNAYGLVLSNLLTHSVVEVSAKKAYGASNIIYLDAREKKEYDVSHIKNAIWCGYNDFNIARVNAVNKNSQVVVYCSVGYRSEKIAEKLSLKGYKVSNMVGGIFEWINLGYPVVDNRNQATEKIHAYDKVWGVWLTRGKKMY